MNVSPIRATGPHAEVQAPELTAPKALRGKPLTGAALRNASPEEQRKTVAMQFEAILVRQLLAPTMSSMLGKQGGAASNVYGDMLTDALSQQLTRGGGFGLGGFLEKQLSPRERISSAGFSDSTEENL